ncbi:MAG: hypothetical protein KTR31_30635 [Myxococcales bacterium]|nr:hypothetical protein [Myxococcales bacterium]
MSEPIDYYSYRPLVVPERPVAVAGGPGAKVGKVARLMSILTGLPLFLLDRAVEHRFGKDLRRVVAEDGADVHATVEAELLARPLSQRTPPIIALGERTLLEPRVRTLVVDAATVVYVRAPGTDPDVHRVLSAIAKESVATAGRHERRVAQELLKRLDLDVELPE